ncbi:MAG: PTS sugar transporter subunit IIC [Gemmatimonadota bacterium]|nr:PTS sugar transporter subunit IIC [Gemmatimonadota bacterium]MDE3127404.1 PTS sugar transporter subunit IIC [Gemmatimonadota bacterium]MDE3172433.1 PTS sugar transporter subunit IIC [Gemmatimonadota bacterium]MDE3215059.1 PTS sugar transporter subunit IIC [Gemmatimonadota bacterium]
MIAADAVAVALLGGVTGLDTVSFPQAMISRPIVAATLGGALAGAPAQGLLVGAVLELIALETLPVGASRYPEWGSASTVAGAIYGAAPPATVGALMAAVFGALIVAWIGGWTMVKLRQRNAATARRHQAALDAGSRGAVVGVQLSGLAADFARGAVLAAAAYVALVPLEAILVGRWAVSEHLTRAVLVATAAAVAVGAMWKLFHATAWARWVFLGGLALGLLMVGAR